MDTKALLEATQPVMEVLHEITSASLSLATMEDGKATFVGRMEGVFSKRPVGLGETFPAYSSAMGKALLSELPETEIDRFYPDEDLKPLTSKTITRKSELKAELAKIRKTGVSITIGETFEGVAGVSSLIRDAGGKAIAAMSIAMPVSKMTAVYQERLGTLIKMGCSLVSRKLGYIQSKFDVRDSRELRTWWEKNKPA